MVMMIINIINNYLKDAFTNSNLVKAHTMQYLILCLVLYSMNIGSWNGQTTKMGN